MKKIDRIILNLKEMMVVGTGGCTGSANSAGPVAGYDPLMNMKKTKKGSPDKRTLTPMQRRWTPDTP
jgi:hypothetical protein